MEAQRSMNFNEFYRSTCEHSINIRAEECFDKVLYHVNSQILKCKMLNVITMVVFLVFLKCCHHLHPLSKVKSYFANKIDKNCSLNIFEMVTSINESMKECLNC
jgi:hypothetical protein